MAGGTAILGGIVAGPVLAVAGGILAAKAEKAKHQAYQNLEIAKAEANKLKAAEVIVKAILDRSNDMKDTISKIIDIFNEGYGTMVETVSQNTDFKTYSEQEKSVIHKLEMIVRTLKNLSNTPLLDKDGELVEKSKETLDKAKELVVKLQEV